MLILDYLTIVNKNNLLAFIWITVLKQLLLWGETLSSLAVRKSILLASLDELLKYCIVYCWVAVTQLE